MTHGTILINGVVHAKRSPKEQREWDKRWKKREKKSYLEGVKEREGPRPHNPYALRPLFVDRGGFRHAIFDDEIEEWKEDENGRCYLSQF